MPLIIRPYEPHDVQAVIDLWQQCGLTVAWNDPNKDIARKLQVNPELFLVGVEGEQVVATVMAGYEGHRGVINYLAVAPGRQRGGLGRRMMDEAEQLLKAQGCPKINLQVRATNTEVIAFYESIGYTVEQNVNMGKRLEHDND